MNTEPRTAHLIYEPTAAGKSTYARKLATEINGVRFAIDEWMQAMFGTDVPLQKSVEKGETYSFDVTPAMFEAKESYFERPTESELSSLQFVRAQQEGAPSWK